MTLGDTSKNAGLRFQKQTATYSPLRLDAAASIISAHGLSPQTWADLFLDMAVREVKIAPVKVAIRNPRRPPESTESPPLATFQRRGRDPRTRYPDAHIRRETRA